MGRNKMETINDSGWQQLEVLKEQEYTTTRGLAKIFRVEPQTIIRGLCINGNYLGLKPVKLPNNRLLWLSVEAEKLLKK